MKHARTAGVAGLALVLAATTGSQVGFGQQKVPMAPGRHSGGAHGAGEPAAAEAADGVRHRRGAADPRHRVRHRRSRTRGRSRSCPTATRSSPSVPGRLRVIRNGKLDPKPVAGAPTARNLGHLGRAGRRPRLHGRGPAPQLRQQQAGLPLLHQAARREAPDDGHRARPLGRQRAGGHEGRLRGRRRQRRGAHRVRARRHALRDDGRRQRGAGRQRAGRQGAAPQGRRHRAAGQPVRRQGRLQARGLHARPPQLARPGGASRHRRRCG